MWERNGDCLKELKTLREVKPSANGTVDFVTVMTHELHASYSQLKTR